MRFRHGFALLSAILSCDALAFPPYRSTDADTAGDQTIELRLGVFRIRREHSDSKTTAPLARTNFGIGENFEIVSEFDYSPDEHRLEEGAFGFKRVQRKKTFAFGVETLLLLPVHSGLSGTGIESQFLTSLMHERWRTHFNAGVFYDPRAPETERGWRTSILTEFPRGRLRPGIEIFGRKAHGEPSVAQAGVGLIAQLERLQIRSGLHFGLNDAAPDVEASLWLAWSWSTD